MIRRKVSHSHIDKQIALNYTVPVNRTAMYESEQEFTKGYTTAGVIYSWTFFIPASSEPIGYACMSIWRLPRGSLISQETNA